MDVTDAVPEPVRVPTPLRDALLEPENDAKPDTVVLPVEETVLVLDTEMERVGVADELCVAEPVKESVAVALDVNVTDTELVRDAELVAVGDEVLEPLSLEDAAEDFERETDVETDVEPETLLL